MYLYSLCLLNKLASFSLSLQDHLAFLSFIQIWPLLAALAKMFKIKAQQTGLLRLVGDAHLFICK